MSRADLSCSLISVSPDVSFPLKALHAAALVSECDVDETEGVLFGPFRGGELVEEDLPREGAAVDDDEDDDDAGDDVDDDAEEALIVLLATGGAAGAGEDADALFLIVLLALPFFLTTLLFLPTST